MNQAIKKKEALDRVREDREDPRRASHPECTIPDLA